MRGHSPVLTELFNGLFKRGTPDSCPPDHFTDCNNVQYSESSVLTRDGIGPFLPYKNIVQIRVFNQTLLALDMDGNLYHTGSPTPFVPVLHIAGMTGFGYVKFADRAYITPNGPQNDFIYVLTFGDTSARKAAGKAPTTAPTGTPGIAGTGNCEQGVHVIAIAYETDTGFLTSLSTGVAVTVPAGGTNIDLSSIPVSPDPFVVARRIVATRAVDPADFTGDLNGYQFFFIGDGGRIDNNTDTTASISFFDAELLDDASHLEDLYDEIPNCGGLNLYHGRLIAWSFPQGNAGEFISTIRVSDPGEPEAINKISGLIEVPRDGLPVTHCQEFRDVLYIFKALKTVASTDNNDVPSSWPQTVIDQGFGASASKAVATVMDGGGTSIDFLLVGNYTGANLFNGTYINPEITWKVRDLWPSGRPSIQIEMDTIHKFIYIVFDTGLVLMGDYNNGLDPMKIRWAKWSFDVKPTYFAIMEDSDAIKLIIASKEAV